MGCFVWVLWKSIPREIVKSRGWGKLVHFALKNWKIKHTKTPCWKKYLICKAECSRLWTFLKSTGLIWLYYDWYMAKGCVKNALRRMKLNKIIKQKSWQQNYLLIPVPQKCLETISKFLAWFLFARKNWKRYKSGSLSYRNCALTQMMETISEKVCWCGNLGGFFSYVGMPAGVEHIRLKTATRHSRKKGLKEKETV